MTALRPGQSPPPVRTPMRMGHDHSMDFDLSDDHRLIQRTVRDFARNEVAPVAEELDKTKAFPYDIVRQLGSLGLMGIPFPEEYGGGGGGPPPLPPPLGGVTRAGSAVALPPCAPTPPRPPPDHPFRSE